MVEFDSTIVSLLDRKILAELDKNCRTPSAVIAKKVKKSRQTVDYRIAHLVESGVISSFVVSFNPHKMGYKLYKVYLKLRNIPEKKTSLLNFLRSSESIFWLGVCSGSWDLIFGVFAKSDYDFFNFKNKLIEDYSDLILSEEGKLPVDIFQFSKMYFTGAKTEPLMFAGEIWQNSFEALDYAIMQNIVNDARIPITLLSEKVGSTPRIVAARLKEMEKKGIIIQYRIGIDLSKIGLELYKTIIRFDKYSEKEANKLLEYVSKIPNTQYLIRHMWDIELEFAVKNNHGYYTIIESLEGEFPYVIRSIESVLMHTDEWGLGFNKILKK
ncbi:MAG: winged helix-turn-helix transcriptional regulator [archaeon]|jgi:Lrp/AsnC family leucine-responsive transcriptional regulator